MKKITLNELWGFTFSSLGWFLNPLYHIFSSLFSWLAFCMLPIHLSRDEKLVISQLNFNTQYLPHHIENLYIYYIIGMGLDRKALKTKWRSTMTSPSHLSGNEKYENCSSFKGQIWSGSKHVFACFDFPSSCNTSTHQIIISIISITISICTSLESNQCQLSSVTVTSALYIRSWALAR